MTRALDRAASSLAKDFLFHAHDDLSDSEFLSFARQIGEALNKNRAREDQLRQAGMQEEANKIYYENKEEAGKILRSSGISPKDFDKRLAKLGAGSRINVKLERLFR